MSRDFIPKAEELFERMNQQASKHDTTGTSLRKIKLPHPESFQYSSTFSQKLTCNIFLVCIYLCV